MSQSTDVTTYILAGGVGSRLSPLTTDRAKPAVPFGGSFRIIDFTLSNCLNSGLRQIYVLTQYKSQSLQHHLRDAWSLLNPQFGEFITHVPPQQRTGDSWYTGTADAVFQNLGLLQEGQSDSVVILSGDHIYRMDYHRMLKEHQSNGADVTVGCLEVCLQDASAFGVMSLDAEQRVRSFEEKPETPVPLPGRPDAALASMGIYIFSRDVLIEALMRDAEDVRSSHDFGRDLLPKLIQTHDVRAYRFGGTSCTESYWQDVGTIDSYFEASMDLLSDSPSFDLHQSNWPVRTQSNCGMPSRIDDDELGRPARVSNTLISSGVVVRGGSVRHSILSPGVRICSGAHIEDCILFDDVHVQEGVHLKRCIVDKGVKVPAGTVVGFNAVHDAARFRVSKEGVVVIPKGHVFTEADDALAPAAGRVVQRSRVAVSSS